VHTEPPGTVPEPHPVKAVMAERGITVRAAARFLEMHEVYLGRVLNGWEEPSRRVRSGLSRLLGLPEADLFRPPQPRQALRPGPRPRVATPGGDAA
jgi:hypothetical protein